MELRRDANIVNNLKLWGVEYAQGFKLVVHCNYFKHLKHFTHFNHFKHVRSLGVKHVLNMFKNVGPPPDRPNSKQFKHVQPQSFRMLKMIKMCGPPPRPQYFKESEHVGTRGLNMLKRIKMWQACVGPSISNMLNISKPGA